MSTRIKLTFVGPSRSSSVVSRPADDPFNDPSCAPDGPTTDANTIKIRIFQNEIEYYHCCVSIVGKQRLIVVTNSFVTLRWWV